MGLQDHVRNGGDQSIRRKPSPGHHQQLTIFGCEQIVQLEEQLEGSQIMLMR